MNLATNRSRQSRKRLMGWLVYCVLLWLMMKSQVIITILESINKKPENSAIWSRK